MASISANLFVVIVSTILSTTLSASVIEDLKNLIPPPDFNTTIMTNCLNNPTLRYCNSSPMDLHEIFKFTIVGSHLCNESKNPNCVESFPKIDLRNRPIIAPLYLSFSFFWKYCPLSVLSIDLSNNSLKGSFPTDLLQCTQIRALDLSHNELSGEFPIESFSPLTNLTVLNLSYNHFLESDQVSETWFFKRFTSTSFLHSGLLLDHKEFRVKLVSLLVGFPIFVILMVGCLGWICLHRPDFLPRMLQSKHKFTPSMLKAATNGFSKKNLVGKSEAVDIYRGTLRDGTKVGVEIYLDNITKENRRKLVQECKVLVQLCHKNTVRVLGWCDKRRFGAIVTEWVEGQSVEAWLLGANPPWKHRLRLMIGVVEGMCYLQERWPDVGYDLRTSSVLLSNNQEPLISRFKIEDDHINNSTKKIYKLGVFLLEIIANRRPHEEFEGGEAGFIEYVRMHYPANLQKAIDEKMKLTESGFEQVKQALNPPNEAYGLGSISSYFQRIHKKDLIILEISILRKRERIVSQDIQNTFRVIGAKNTSPNNFVPNIRF
ncbi:Putative leucine-rich repeat receptor-like serine/threonine-protein kinase [Morus notabilis]|uniref:Putative leucine-rich repeat receptor-like serine/threonine-protein kinase n=1 Tax=Morus notabilis TaxID=981085 RepID=W9RI61_9ROSA|nr:Putative leucine-rich repeat receptor-like serine/threonine-protein kinase [Morus notabilis]